MSISTESNNTISVVVWYKTSRHYHLYYIYTRFCMSLCVCVCVCVLVFRCVYAYMHMCASTHCSMSLCTGARVYVNGGIHRSTLFTRYSSLVNPNIPIKQAKTDHIPHFLSTNHFNKLQVRVSVRPSVCQLLTGCARTTAISEEFTSMTA